MGEIPNEFYINLEKNTNNERSHYSTKKIK